jgi:hypothetical protein
MMVFSSRKNSITLIYQDQRGSLFFLVVDQGIMPSLHRKHRDWGADCEVMSLMK